MLTSIVSLVIEVLCHV